MAQFLAMRSSLRWLLAVSALLSALAWWWPDNVSQAVARAGSASETLPLPSVPSSSTATVPDAASTALPDHLPTLTLDKAAFDPFVGLQPPAPPPPKPTPKPTPQPAYVPPPPPAPVAPTLTYRYLGQMTDPSGKKVYYLAKADKDVPIVVGTPLDEGYVVEAITADLVRLRYPPLDVRVEIRIPPASD